MVFVRSLLLYLGVPAVLCALASGVWSQRTGAGLNGLLLAPAVAVLALVVLAAERSLAAVYRFLFLPYDFYGDEAADSFLVEKGDSGLSPAEIIANMKRTRAPGNVPPVYPNGWFVVCRSTDVGIKGTKYVHMMGECSIVLLAEDRFFLTIVKV